MNKIPIAILAIFAVMAVPVFAYGDVLFSFGTSPAEMHIETIDGESIFSWDSEIPANYVYLQGARQALTADDIRAGDTRFYDVTEITSDISRITFPIGSNDCIWVIEDYDGGRFDVKSLLCS